MPPERLFIPCRANDQESCPLFPECYEDDHHLFARRLGKEALLGNLTEAEKITVKDFIEDPRNKVRSCRHIHTKIFDRLPIPLPPMEYMQEFNANGKP